MSDRPVIAIAPTHLPKAGDIRLAENYYDSVIAAGGAPLILPLSAEPSVYETLFPLIDGVLLTGGDDIDPARYGAEPLPGIADAHPVTPLRDEVEYRLIAWAEARDLPILGICRGLQILNVYHGGTLYQDLEQEHPASPSHRSPAAAETPAGEGGSERAPLCAHCLRDEAGDYDGDHIAHDIALEKDSLTARVLGGDHLAVNSLHHQAVRQVGTGLCAVAWAPDGVIEALEATDGRRTLAVQWHPEYFGTQDPHRRLFRWLVDESAR